MNLFKLSKSSCARFLVFVALPAEYLESSSSRTIFLSDTSNFLLASSRTLLSEAGHEPALFKMKQIQFYYPSGRVS